MKEQYYIDLLSDLSPTTINATIVDLAVAFICAKSYCQHRLLYKKTSNNKKNW